MTLQDDLAIVDKNVQLDAFASGLGIKTAAAKQFLRYALANTLLMDRKQQDYGSNNISKFMAPGVVVRVSDKVERLINLFYPKDGNVVEPKNESREDSFRDISNYGNIGLLCLRGEWPCE